MGMCCEEDYSAERKRREAEEEAAKAIKISVDGVDMTVGDLFDSWEAVNVAKKIKLVRLGKGDKPGTKSIEDQLFGGPSSGEDSPMVEMGEDD